MLIIKFVHYFTKGKEKNYMKGFLILVVCLTLVLALSACAPDEVGQEEPTAEFVATATQVVAEATTPPTATDAPPTATTAPTNAS